MSQINLMEMSDRQRLQLRKNCLADFFNFCVGVMGYDDISEDVHGSYCSFLSSPAKRKQVTMPRSFVKTWIGSIAYPIWATLKREQEDEFPYYKAWEDKFWTLGPNMRVLIASYVISNASKMVHLIRDTYASNQAMQILFPEVIPINFNKTRWSDESACINRSENFTESTFETAGIGGSSISRHYDFIIEDDLVYAKKDDFTDKELQPDMEDIEKAIGWHKAVTSLLVPGKHTRIHNAGTRWAKHDLIDWIERNEPYYELFRRACVHEEADKHWTECKPTWPECYDIEQLEVIAKAQGPYLFSTQYLLKPAAPEDYLFQEKWLQFYDTKKEVPETIRKFTTVDLSLWSEPTRKSDCNGVILTCGWCDKNHMWVLDYDIGRFNPTQVIKIMAKHWKLHSPEFIGVESVYYQKALAYFARQAMEEGKVPWMTIRELKPEGNASKEVRIRALEPLASNHAIHCRKSHKEWIEEYCEYIPNSRLCKKDLLDTAAYQVQIARPGSIKPLGPVRLKDYEFKVDMDEVLEKAMSRNKRVDAFGNPDVPMNPYGEIELGSFGDDLNYWDVYS